jgi:hypothetical protein
MSRLLACGCVVAGLLAATAVSAFVGIRIAGIAIVMVTGAGAGDINHAIAEHREAIRLDPTQAKVLSWRSAARQGAGIDSNAGN